MILPGAVIVPDGGSQRESHTQMLDLLKTAVSIFAAAAAAYGAIKVDLARTMGDVSYLQQTASRHEAAIDRLREIQAAQTAARDAARSQSAGR